MTIQRKYSLPNCTLVVEGLSDGSMAGQSTPMRPLISILVNAECHFPNSQQPPLTGGRDFFNGLVNAVSAYAQEFLSKVRHPEAHNNESGLVQLQQVENNRHRLIVRSLTREHTEGDSGSAQPSMTIDLTTVQLFDLVEAVDQFFADSQTLPDLSLRLTPVSKSYTASSQPLAKQAVPAAVGVSSLALAAIAFFFVPIPEVQRPSEPRPQSNSGQSTNLVAAPEITEPSQLNALQQRLYNQLNQAWKTRAKLEQDLSFRVVMADNGALIGYKSVDAAANEAIAQTPLPDLLYNPAADRTVSQKPNAQFRVMFTTDGELQVSPWDRKN